MTVLVTGGTGFLGSHLIEQLTRTGDSVRALARSSIGDELLRSLGATPIRGDLGDADSLDRACEGCEAVYHSAARVELDGSEEEFHETSVAGTRRLVEAAGRAGVRRFVQVSSCAVYLGSVPGPGNLIDESTPVFEPPQWFGYSRAKYHAEQTVRTCCLASLEWTIVRLGALYGPRNRAIRTYLEPALKDSMMRIVGDGRNNLLLVYVEDAARAVILAGRCKEAAGKTFLVGPIEPCTQQEYFNAMADGFGVPRPTKHINYHLAFFLAWLGEYFGRSGPRRAWSRRALIAIVGLPVRANCDYTRKVLGWEPKISFAEGMERTFEWYRAEYPKAGFAAGSAFRSAQN
jgi:nucleoside-diphosphate-sugar epimerase